METTKRGGVAILKQVVTSLPFILLVAVAAGLGIGSVASAEVIAVVATIGDVLRQVIVFCVPLIIVGFIAPSIAKLGENVSRILGVALLVAYLSTLGAALLSMAAGFGIIPHLTLAEGAEALREVPSLEFPLDMGPNLCQSLDLLFLSFLSIFIPEVLLDRNNTGSEFLTVG